jgi:hypothetical protein
MPISVAVDLATYEALCEPRLGRSYPASLKDKLSLIMRSDGRGLERLGFYRVAVTRSANLNWALSTPVTRILFRYPVSTLHK